MKMSERAAVATHQPHDRIVANDDVARALDFLRDNAIDIGKAKQALVEADGRIKIVLALEMKRHNDLSAAKAEVEARCSQNYEDALTKAAIAAGEFEKMRGLREAAAAKIEAWRSEQATWRSMKI